MDNLLPFLPRVAHIEPLNKRLIYVAGIKDAKIKFIKDQNKDDNTYSLNPADEKTDDDLTQVNEDNKLDTWA